MAKLAVLKPPDLYIGGKISFYNLIQEVDTLNVV